MRINVALFIAIIVVGLSFEVTIGFGYGKTWLPDSSGGELKRVKMALKLRTQVDVA
jgi:hypothetical protein